jgi:hypothetical protein
MPATISARRNDALLLLTSPAVGKPGRTPDTRSKSNSLSSTHHALAITAFDCCTTPAAGPNFNKYPEAEELLKAMVEERLGLEFFVQCDTQIARQEDLIELLGKRD